MADEFLGISSDPVRFQEAIAALRRRVPMTDDAFSALEQQELEFAFTVADVAQLDVVLDVYEAIQSAVADGTTFEDFKAEVGEKLEAAWGEEDGARLETVFRTNVQTSYNGGRYEAAQRVKEDRPYWRFDGPDDTSTSDICRPCIGVVLAADHPWWQTHYSPLHHRCRHRVSTLTQAQAEREGITAHPPSVDVPSGFGLAPTGGGGSSWEPDPAEYPDAIRAALEDRLDETG